MTREQLVAALDAIKRALNAERVQIVRVIVDEVGNEVGRIYRGSFIRPRNKEDS